MQILMQPNRSTLRFWRPADPLSPTENHRRFRLSDGRLNVETLIEVVSEMKNIVNIKGEQLVKVGSQDMNDKACMLL
ncbi:hypothetical protein [Exercitatus varius]|uniref:hypothetical protein n=1 Tax=Exercitatus varius TaxID=67857 RepID=UPI00294B8FBC|nr:hypothetical protein [Exercitatus varius]MDG2951635.1 hypothetical protein [Exercitatus varius]